MPKNYLVLDIGTTGIKAIIFDDELRIIKREYKKIGKSQPQTGWVEQDPKELVDVSRELLRKVCSDSELENIAGLGITNQRETTIIWDKNSGEPVYPAIVWEDARTKEYCETLKPDHEELILSRTGLVLDSYFSASKINWILNKVETRDGLIFGTVDTWLIWNLCKDNPHVTDCTNASRTLLYNIVESKWDNELLEVFDVPKSLLPEVKASQSHFGDLLENVVGAPIPVLAIAGDQQSSLYAAGTSSSTTKVTYGTGAFMMQVLGDSFETHSPFFTTLAPGRDCHLYALEAKVADCGVRVTAALDDENELRAVLTDIAKEVDEYVKLLPNKPNEIIIDGGAVRDGIMKEVQEEVSGIPVIQQDPFDGTALGAAKLVKDSLN